MASNLLRALLQEEEDDDDDDYATLLAIASLEEQHSSEGQSSFRRGSIPGHVVIQRNRAKVETHDSYFVQKRDAAGKISLSSLQKVSAAMRMLAYRVSAVSVDDYVRIGKSTAIESLSRFTKAIVAIFYDEYLRPPTDEETARLLAISKQQGFPGMLGSIECMH
ncbi:uncharacterized protein LOC109826523 [Asparagus officinalis]|uniref:uncharacterized protein LOC109826523 n=1 Tax=Asparagus officinalis TaxID=4686 RepID=UPI00098E2803|nr:uncharacterized protein LOC109826523 [Asparagus officinalis]